MLIVECRRWTHGCSQLLLLCMFGIFHNEILGGKRQEKPSTNTEIRLTKGTVLLGLPSQSTTNWGISYMVAQASKHEGSRE